MGERWEALGGRQANVLNKYDTFVCSGYVSSNTVRSLMASALLFFSGCTFDQGWIEPAISAAPIDDEVYSITNEARSTIAAPGDSSSKKPPNVYPPYSGEKSVKSKLEYLMYKSSDKCGNFLDKITSSQNMVNTSGDVLGTVLSGLGAIFSPIATAHALSGAATIVTGTKTAVDSNFWAKQGVQDYAQAITSTYYKDIGSFYTELAQGKPNEDGSTIAVQEDGKATTYDLYGGILKIQAIHAECKLASAGASIRKTLGGTDQTATPSASGPSTPAAGAAATKSLLTTPGHAIK